MIRYLALLLFLVMGFHPGFSQPTRVWHTVTDDLSHFWEAYDHICTTNDTTLQLGYIQRLYMDRASEGLKAFMRNKDGLAKRWVATINNDRVFWDSLRPRMALVSQVRPLLEASLGHYQHLYPSLKPADLFFLIGIRQQGGTTRNNQVLIGLEVVLADQAATVDKLLLLCLHEYTHTQQSRPDFRHIDVLTSSIREGACDFMAELVTGKTIVSSYRAYGETHESAVWSAFVRDMYTNQNDRWVSTGANPELPAPDLGYFVGYQINRSFYRHALDKAEAIRAILQLDFTDRKAVTRFLQASQYRR